MAHWVAGRWSREVRHVEGRHRSCWSWFLVYLRLWLRSWRVKRVRSSGLSIAAGSGHIHLIDFLLIVRLSVLHSILHLVSSHKEILEGWVFNDFLFLWRFWSLAHEASPWVVRTRA